MSEMMSIKSILNIISLLALLFAFYFPLVRYIPLNIFPLTQAILLGRILLKRHRLYTIIVITFSDILFFLTFLFISNVIKWSININLLSLCGHQIDLINIFFILFIWLFDLSNILYRTIVNLTISFQFGNLLVNLFIQWLL